MKYIPKNLLPRLNQFSKPNQTIRNIIEDILNNPIVIKSSNHSEPYILSKQISPYQNNSIVCHYNKTSTQGLESYLTEYQKSKNEWKHTSWDIKKKIFLQAADLIENDYYDKMLAYTMVSQNKSVFEAEIDAVCELADFIRFNVYYTELIMKKQPVQTYEHENISEYHPLNGFVASITPFNFTAIAGNLATVPLFFGNSVIWKPSDNSILSNYLFYEILLESGLPSGVLNFCPMEPKDFSQVITNNPELGAILFTGSTTVLENLYLEVGKNISVFENFPKIIGESGGKNFHLIDDSYVPENNKISSNNLPMVILKSVEGAFNFSGQKCSACSTLYYSKNDDKSPII